ncbi:MAG TPA: DUF5709 domain-containing protein [Streptosporangiaceae bacterium]|nr:DUF5709 domain-containing protein [Streptosporangiaceae bacterium]
MTNDGTSGPQYPELGPEYGIEDESVLDPQDTLEDDPAGEPLDQSIVPPDRWSAADRYGTTAAEEEAGESLGQHLAEEDPDIDPYAEDEDATGTGGSRAGGYTADPRSGRLVAADAEEDADEAAADDDPDLVARDVGVDAGAASAEEAAVHTLDSGSEDAEDESPEPPGGW